mgnify:CR=1 FL=1
MTLREENLVTLVDAFKLPAGKALRLQFLARRLQRYHLLDCNVGLTPRQEWAEDRAWAEVQRIALAYNLHVYHQGDPRDWPIVIDLEPVAENDTFGKKRVCPL